MLYAPLLPRLPFPNKSPWANRSSWPRTAPHHPRVLVSNTESSLRRIFRRSGRLPSRAHRALDAQIVRVEPIASRSRRPRFELVELVGVRDELRNKFVELGSVAEPLRGGDKHDCSTSNGVFVFFGV